MPIIGQFGSLAGLGSMILPGGVMESIATITVGSGGASSIEFTSIPGTYQHLQLRAVLLVTTANNPGLRLGNASVDSGANYRSHHLWGNGSGAFSNDQSQTSMMCNYNPSTSYPSAQITDVLDYASTSKYKTTRTFAGSDTNGGTSEVAMWSGLWMSTAAVTHVALVPASGNFAQYSTAALYGVKAP
jgi:hypothetical protein